MWPVSRTRRCAKRTGIGSVAAWAPKDSAALTGPASSGQLPLQLRSSVSGPAGAEPISIGLGTIIVAVARKLAKPLCRATSLQPHLLGESLPEGFFEEKWFSL